MSSQLQDQSINDLMPRLLEELKAILFSERIFWSWFPRHIERRNVGDFNLSSPFRCRLEIAANALAEKLNIKIMGRSRGQKVIIGDDYVVEQLNVHGRTLNTNKLKVALHNPMHKCANICWSGHVMLLKALRKTY